MVCCIPVPVRALRQIAGTQGLEFAFCCLVLTHRGKCVSTPLARRCEGCVEPECTLENHERLSMHALIQQGPAPIRQCARIVSASHRSLQELRNKPFGGR